MFRKRRKRSPLKKRKVIAVTLGDPEGIGPEIICRSLSSRPPRGPMLVIGSNVFSRPAEWLPVATVSDIGRNGVYFLDVAAAAGSEPSFAYVRVAADLALAGQVQALVTAPISKEKWLRAGIPYSGHTDFLARSAGVSRYGMLFWSPRLKVALYTIHLPLRDIFPAIRKEKIAAYLLFLDAELQRLFKKKFRYFISGLNPHAGENGYLGKEEISEIAPALESLRGRVQVEGIFPPDTVFIAAQRSPNAVVVAWYHDQGLIPFKLLSFRSGVNLTLGLPYIRTSPDHGTAGDIAGRGIADVGSMNAAIRLAERLIR